MTLLRCWQVLTFWEPFCYTFTLTNTPETKGCAGYHSFGFNRKEQLKQIIAMPFAALLIAWVYTLL